MSVGQPLVDGAYVEAAAQGGEGVQVGGALHVYVSSIKDARLPTYLPTSAIFVAITVQITILEHLKGEDQIVFKHKKKMLGLVEDTRDRQTAHQNFNSCDPH